MEARPQAVVVGGSVAGLATACGLAMREWSVVVLERSGDFGEAGRAILLQPNGLAALERLGVLEEVRQRGHRLARVAFYDRRHRPIATWEWTTLRHPHSYAIEIRPAVLRMALAERLAALGAEPPRMGCAAVGIVRRGDVVAGVRYRGRADDEHEIQSTCVIGADGPESTVRRILAIDLRRLGPPDRYLLGTVNVPARGDELAVHLGHGYGDGVVPLGDATYFWDKVTAENRPAVDAHDLDGWRRVFEERMPPGSALPGAVTSWGELTMVEVRPFWALEQVGDGFALAGDAAGAVHPHTAQGANLALEDAVALGDALSGYAGGAPPPRRLLARYGRPRTRRRRRFVLQSLLAAGVMDAPSPAWRALRAANLTASRVPAISRLLLGTGAT